MKMDDGYAAKSNQIRQLAALPPEQLVDHLSNLHPGIDSVAPNIAPHIHSAAINAIQFLNSKLPTAGNELAQDEPLEPSKAQKSQWLDLHDTVSDPVSVLDHVKNQTLNRRHIEAMQSVYPDLHQEMIQKMGEQLGKMKSEGKELPYKKRVSMSLFMGQPVDSTMTPQFMQSVLMANSGKQGQQTQAAQKKASGSELSQVNKVNSMYQTPLQARSIDKRE